MQDLSDVKKDNLIWRERIRIFYTLIDQFQEYDLL